MNHNLTHFSFSSISMFKNCPRSFEYRYIKQVAEAFNSIEAYMGSCVHSTLEWAYLQRNEGIIPTLQNALEQFKYNWNLESFENIRIIKEDKTREDYYLQGCEFITRYFDHIFHNDRSTTLYLELQFQLPLNEEIVYKGVIDRVSKSEDGTLRIIDYKTGKVDNPMETLQLPSYAMYVFQHNIDPYIELCYEDLRENRTVVARILRKDVKNVRENLLKDIELILKTKPGEFYTQPSVLCQWCGYNHICDNPHESVKMKRNSAANTPPDFHLQSQVSSNEAPMPTGDYTEACPKCGSPLQEKKGKFGNFIGCSDFPRCRYTRDLGVDSHNAAADPNVEGKDICPECGGLLKQRKGKFGSFFGCANYPQCRFTRPV